MANVEIQHAAEKGHNIIITGQAGTGKSYILKQLYSKLITLGKNVQVTATTGIASTLLPDAATVHSFFGLLDGRFTTPELYQRILLDDNYHTIRDRIAKIDVLMIDEVSMLSENIFEQVEQTCRFVKDVDTIFGGIQVILCGDFLQLKPVANQKYNDPGNHILHSDKFRFHKFVLTEVHRQSEDTLIKAVHELGKGTDVSQQTVDFLNRMKRKLPPGDVPVKLFARNYDVDKYNSDHLMGMEGEIKTFRAADVGDTKQLKSCPVDHLIYLKNQAKVMLVVNLSAKRVNGLCGTIIKMNNDSVEVQFDFINQVVKIERYQFAVYSPEKRQDIACRSQIPLKLAFAITTHKAQGLTLKRVEIDCRHMTNPGQIGVAIGRASEIKGLRVLNFSKKLVTKHNESIYDFYSSESISLHDDFSCCKAITTEPEARPSLEGAKTAEEENTLTSQLPEGDPSSDEGEDLTQELEDINILDQLFGEWENERVQEVLLEHPLPVDFNLQIVLKEMLYKETLTDEQLTLNICITEIKTCTEKVQLFGDTIHNQLFAFYKDSMPSEKNQTTENRHVTACILQKGNTLHIR